jgi:hypothetical protein
MTKASPRERVHQGVIFLDEHEEPGWDRRVDLWRLSIGSSHDCLLGQLYGGQGYKNGFTAALRTHDELVYTVCDMGFMFVSSDDARALTRAWKRVIRERRRASRRAARRAA